MNTLTEWFNQNQTLLIDYAIKVVVALAIFVIGKWIAKAITNLIARYMQKQQMDQTVISFTSGLLNALLIGLVFIIAISHLGFNTSSLVAIVGAAGLAVGLALQGSLSNFASGVLLIVFKPFKAGDFIEVAGKSGIVEELLVFSTKLRTGDNKTIIIPNGAITSGTITNFSTKPTRRVDLVIGVSYDADLAKTKQILSDVVSQHPLVLKDQAITIGVNELAESSVNFVVRPWVNSADYWTVYFDLNEQIKIALDNAGIEIPYPQLSIHVNKEDSHEA
jgi:small conductance mechanosensitive channel